MGIFGSKAERCRVLVVELMNVFIKYTSVKRLVSYDDIVSNHGSLTKAHTEIMEHILEHKEDGNLGEHGLP